MRINVLEKIEAARNKEVKCNGDLHPETRCHFMADVLDVRKRSADLLFRCPRCKKWIKITIFEEEKPEERKEFH